MKVTLTHLNETNFLKKSLSFRIKCSFRNVGVFVYSYFAQYVAPAQFTALMLSNNCVCSCVSVFRSVSVVRRSLVHWQPCVNYGPKADH
jgi:hypothetical protein